MESLTTDDRLPVYEDVVRAAERLADVAVTTPLLRSDALDARVGGRVWLKAEPLQRTGSFKIRGAYNRLCQLVEGGYREKGVVAFSSGNHAQGVAQAALMLGLRATIVMPRDAPAAKIENTRRAGAEIVLFDRWTEDREAIAATIARETGAVVVPSYDDSGVIAGQGTVGLELVRQMEAIGVTPDLVLVPASGGGLVAGIALALAHDWPAARIHTVEPEGFDDHRRSLEAGMRVANAPGARSICDALLADRPGRLTFAVNRERLAGGFAVSEAEISRAMDFAFRELKLVVEPGGAVALAAILAGRPVLDGRVAAIVLSGGNVDPALFTECLQRAAVDPPPS